MKLVFQVTVGLLALQGDRTMGEKGSGSRKMATVGTMSVALTAAARRGDGGSSGMRRCMTSVARWPVLLLVAALSLFQVSAIEIYTPPELSVENGTEAKLECTFTSTEVVSSAASVLWSFQAEGAPSPVSFFYYFNGRAYPGKDIPFKDRISWSGDLNKKDASISIANTRFQDNGIYICDVKNPPDIVVTPGEIRLRVVEEALCLASCTVRWCTISDPEQAKCTALQTCLTGNITMSCVRKGSYRDCIEAIANSEADAITLDGGLVYEAGLAPYNLKPVAAEVYGAGCATSYYAVAVVKKEANIASLCALQGKKSCHTGYGRSAGWVIPIGRLLDKNCIQWDGSESEPIHKDVARFFSAACVPEVPKGEPNLCRLCQDQAQCSSSDAYAGYAGALKCLKDGIGDVSFVKDATLLSLSENERSRFELLCDDDTRKPLEQYELCNLARVPAHAVVARSVDGRTDEIWNLVSTLQKQYPKNTTGQCQFFGSSHGKDLLIKDSAEKLIRVPAKMDTQLYLGPQYYAAIQNIRKERPTPDTTNKVRWCTIGRDEKAKCDTWSAVSGGVIECAVADSPEDAIVKILKNEADAVSLDGGLVYIAGECGLVPVVSEITSEKDIEACRTEGTEILGTYYAVAVVKKSNHDISWKTLQGKKSCHTARGRTAGWNLPMGLVIDETGITDVDHFFSAGCAPGSPVDSPLCNLCVGSGSNPPVHKCAPNSNELYYGYTGAFRCLVQSSADVAFVKHTTVTENTDGNNQDAWASNLKSEDFELLCRNGERAPISSYSTCNLGKAPPHGVVTRADRADHVRRVLANQEALYGSNGSEKNIFQMFESDDPKKKDILFKEGTRCLGKVKKGTTYEEFLSNDYVAAIRSINKLSPSALVEACTFHHRGCTPSN